MGGIMAPVLAAPVVAVLGLLPSVVCSPAPFGRPYCRRGRRRKEYMTRTMALVCLILSTAVIASACGRDAQAASQPAAETGMALHGDFSGSGPGTLHSASTLPAIDLRLSEVTSIAARVEYTSSSVSMTTRPE